MAIYEKLTAEQVRANYREEFFVADLLPPTIVDALDASGLIHSSKLSAPLKVSIPLWDERPPIPGQVNVLTMEWLPASSTDYLPIGIPEEIADPSTFPDSNFPLQRTIPELIFDNYEGIFQFRYRVSNWNGGGERESPAAQVTIDRTGPIWADPEHAVIDIDENLITDAVLVRDGGVKCTIPDFIEANRVDVMVHVAWLDRVPLPSEDLAQFIVLSRLLPPDRKVLIPASAVIAYGSTTQYAVAFLIDKAGNRGEISLPATVPVALGTLPSALRPCTVPLALDGVVDRADAAFPTKVHIESYTGWGNDDGIVVKWGTNLARTSVGAHLPFPLAITVPWPHMAREYDFNSATHVQPVAVDYQVFRGDVGFASPGGISVNTDFAIPGPVNPNPEPINPSLNLIVFESFSGSSTELTLADVGEDATASIELFDDPEIGDTLTLYYNGVAVISSSNPYVVDGTETANQVIDIVIPWADIELTPVMDDLPMYYTLTRAGFANPQESDRTTIDVFVETVDLPAPEFPEALINCNSLRQQTPGSGPWGVFIHIPASNYLKEGATVAPDWKTYEYDGTTLIPDTEHTESLTVSSEQERNGIDWFVPYDECLKPTYRPPVSGGKGKMNYTITVRGNPEPSPTIDVIVAVFEGNGSGNDHCLIPRP